MLLAVKVELHNPMTFVWCSGYQPPHSEVLGLIPAEVSASSPHVWFPPRSKNKHYVHLESEFVFGVLLQRELHRARSALWWSARVSTRDASVVMRPKPKRNNRTFQPRLMTLSLFCVHAQEWPRRQKAGFFFLKYFFNWYFCLKRQQYEKSWLVLSETVNKYIKPMWHWL